jgi:hypothetical protein
VVSGCICLANGSISVVLTRRLPLVSSLAPAICDIGIDAAGHRLDCEHYPHLRHVALAHTWTSVGGSSSLGNAAGIRMPGDSCHNYRFAPEDESTYNAHRTGRVKPTRSSQFASRNFRWYPTLVLFIGFCVNTGLWAMFRAAPSCYADQQLDPTDIKVSIDTSSNTRYSLRANCHRPLDVTSRWPVHHTDVPDDPTRPDNRIPHQPQ